eukprot:scaffold116609_cov69-Phaeocystis_antarctica.AAC.3
MLAVKLSHLYCCQVVPRPPSLGKFSDALRGRRQFADSSQCRVKPYASSKSSRDLLPPRQVRRTAARERPSRSSVQ